MEKSTLLVPLFFSSCRRLNPFKHIQGVRALTRRIWDTYNQSFVRRFIASLYNSPVKMSFTHVSNPALFVYQGPLAKAGLVVSDSPVFCCLVNSLLRHHGDSAPIEAGACL